MYALSRPKLMIIEDHHATLDAIRMIFEFEGYQVLGLSGANDLQNKISSFQPDVILIDILLGTTDGRIICSELKHSVHAPIPILLMSSRNGIQNSNSYKPYWDAYIDKPFEMETIIESVQKLLLKNTKSTNK